MDTAQLFIIAILIGIGVVFVFAVIDSVIDSRKRKAKSVAKKFRIEYYPLSGSYCATYGGMYLKKRYHTGIYDLESDLLFAEMFRSESSARLAIRQYKEQTFKSTVKVIEVE